MPEDQESVSISVGPQENDAAQGEKIKEAMYLIQVGTSEINDVFTEARGPLPKKAMKEIHQRIQKMRQAAEAAEDAFRDWTIELGGGASSAKRAAHDNLRARFEVQVQSIQTCMTRVAEEIKRRKVVKTDVEAGTGVALASAEPTAATLATTADADFDLCAPEPSRVHHEEEVAENLPQNSSGASFGTNPPSRWAGSWASSLLTPRNLAARAVRAVDTLPALSRVQASSSASRATAHARMAQTLRKMATDEQEMHKPFTPRDADVHLISRGCSDDRKSGHAKKKAMSALPPWVKAIVGIIFFCLCFMIWTHARLMVSEVNAMDAHAKHVLGRVNFNGGPGTAFVGGQPVDVST
jgi:hypothetical protein